MTTSRYVDSQSQLEHSCHVLRVVAVEVVRLAHLSVVLALHSRQRAVSTVTSLTDECERRVTVR